MDKNGATKDTGNQPSDKPTGRLFGERLNISGDFDGDGKKDTIFESYISEMTGRETFKTLDSSDWEENIGLVIKNKPISRLYSSINGVDTFIVTKELQQAGISMFENLGDLNNDKGDEIGYLINWTDYSNLNTYHILTLSKGKKWKELLSFPINEAVSFDPENLFKDSSIINKVTAKTMKYKFYSDSATVEEGVIIFR